MRAECDTGFDKKVKFIYFVEKIKMYTSKQTADFNNAHKQFSVCQHIQRDRIVFGCT